jgi:hypothetical protein
VPFIGNSPCDKQGMAAELVDLIDFHFPDSRSGGRNWNEKVSR